tara:strand:+ start:11 stop:223 length:213 start_codon:yes stop_codon:yes gene_type:complete
MLSHVSLDIYTIGFNPRVKPVKLMEREMRAKQKWPEAVEKRKPLKRRGNNSSFFIFLKNIYIQVLFLFLP